MLCKGNEMVNKVYEANLEPGLKPTTETPDEQVKMFITQKYDEKKFYKDV